MGIIVSILEQIPTERGDILRSFFEKFGQRRLFTGATLLLMLAVGMMLLIQPEGIYNLVLNVAGGVILAFGVIRIITYFKGDAYEAMQDSRFTTGLLMGLAGLALIVFKPLFISILPFLLGAVLIIGGAFRLQGAIALKRLHGQHHQPVLVSSIVSIALGLLVVFNPFESGMILLRVIGAALILEAVMDGVYTHQFQKWKDDFTSNFR